MRILLVLFYLFLLTGFRTVAQTSCGQVFTNPGGISNGYEPGTFLTDTLQSEDGQRLMLNFSVLSLGENDTLSIYDPFFFDETVSVITSESELPVIESVSPWLVWVLNASGTNGGDGWEASVSCIEAAYFEIQTDTICAGFEGFLPWEVNLPNSFEMLIFAELSGNQEFEGDVIALGENQISSDSFYLQTGALLGEGIYYLRLSAEDTAYSFLQNIQTVYIKALPVVPVISGENLFCTGDTVQIQVSTEIRTNYAWFLNGLELEPPFTEQLDVAQSGTFTVSAGNVCGTVLSEPFEVFALSYPDAPVLLTDQTFVCPGENLEISIQNPPVSEVDFWFSESIQIAQDTVSISVSEASLVFVVRQNTCGSVVSDTLLIEAPGLPPQVLIETPGGTEFCPGSSLSLQAAIPPGNNYQWFTDNLPVDAPASWQTSVAGTYSLQLSNSCGIAVSLNQPELVMLAGAQPATLQAAGPTELCEGEIVLLIADAQPGEVVRWYVNDTLLQTGTIQFSATESGNYFVTTSTACGTVNSQNTIAVTINPLPVVPIIFELGNPALCNGSSVDLFVSPQTGVSFSWKRNNSAFVSGANSITTNQAGLYTVLATNSCGTVNGAGSVSVTSGNTPVSTSIQANGPLTFCEGLQVTLQTSPQNGVVYTWLLNGIAQEGSNFSFAAQQAGVYSLQLSNACDTLFASNSITVNVNPLPPAYQITPFQEQSLCLGESVILSIPATPGVSYQWRLNESPTGQNSTQLNASAEGEYTLVLANTCGSTPALNSVIVNVDSLSPAPPQIIAQPGTALCPGGYVLLNAPPVPFQQYTWLLNGEPVLGAVNPVLKATEWGLYSVQASNACGVSDVSPTVELGPGDPPQDFELYTTGGLSVCENDSIAITAQVNFGIGLRWFRDGVLFYEGPAQVYVNQAGTYTASAWNGCGEAIGLNQIDIDVLPVPEIPFITLNDNSLVTNAGGQIQWYNSAFQPLPGQNSSSFLPPQTNASYYVSSTNEFGCTSFSEPFNYIVNSLSSVFNGKTGLYPNPAKGQVFMFSMKDEPITLRDAEGRLLHVFESQTFKSQIIQLDVSFLTPGIYLLSQGQRTMRLLIMN